MPIWPLIASLAAQTLATMALFSLPAIAPAVAGALQVSGELVGLFVALAYGIGIISALLSPGFIHRYGGVRALQGVLGATAACCCWQPAAASLGSASPAVVLGLGYGAARPASTHLLVPHTPARVFNMVMSLRQIGVPLGGVLGSLLLPPLVLRIGWREALLAEIPGSAAACRAATDTSPPVGHEPATWPAPDRAHAACTVQTAAPRANAASFDRQLFLFRHAAVFCRLHDHPPDAVAGFDLVSAGQALAVYQITGAVTRPVWGWIADRWMTPGHTLALHGFGMAAAALAAGTFGPHWSHA